MILSDRDIRIALKEKRVVIDPLFPKAIQPASVDVHLGSNLLVFRDKEHAFIDPKKPVDEMMQTIRIGPKHQFIIGPGEFALGMTYETIGVGADMAGHLEGKSSVGRLGLIIHATAGYLDPGNKLKMTLELHNVSTMPIKLYYKMPIAQMSFTILTSPAEHPYGRKQLGSKYFGSKKPQASQYWKNFKKNNEWIKFKR